VLRGIAFWKEELVNSKHSEISVSVRTLQNLIWGMYSSHPSYTVDNIVLDYAMEVTTVISISIDILMRMYIIMRLTK